MARRANVRAVSLLLMLPILCAGTAMARAQQKNPEGVPVLLLSGGERGHHGYRDQAFYLSRKLEDTGRYRVTIVEDAALLESPALRKYAMVIANADRRDPEFKLTESQQRALLDYVKSGRGYVSIHGADNAPGDWLPEMKDLLGGIYSHFGLPDGKAIRGDYLIRVTAPEHPIMEGISDFSLSDELYSNMQMKDDVKPLATIDHEGVAWPVAWTYRYGRGPVFHTSLGHRGFAPDADDPLHDPNLGRMIVQGIDWVAAEVAKSESNSTSEP